MTNSVKTYSITFAIVAIAAGVSIFSFIDLDGNILSAEALPPSNCTIVKNIDADRKHIDFHMPQNIPATHSLEDNYVDDGFVALYFAKGPMCQEGAEPQTFENGLIKYIEANADSHLNVQIEGGAERLELYVNISDYPDRAYMGKINGLPASFLEPGIRSTLFIDDESGEVIDKHDDWSPGEISVVDEVNKKYYKIVADMPIKDLKTIMERTLS